MWLVQNFLLFVVRSGRCWVVFAAFSRYNMLSGVKFFYKIFMFRQCCEFLTDCFEFYYVGMHLSPVKFR